ncbi:sortase-associated OmpA-like protein PdsO [Thalassotalea sediminis]|uniref:sortase-associated OmpA-like protein PdsO n=1 Tax=Thalassotalea sediminis TaxID=1759089 RepID=UPI002572E019|nr:sortase-associated OmpA-like protein PdsO [Thalassotalea sediminis]
MKIKNNAKRSLIAAITLSAMVAPTTYASEQESDETKLLTHEQEKNNVHIGFGSGAVIGAVVAGPLGAIVSSAIGAFAAKHYNANEQREGLSAKLSQSQEKYQLALKSYQNKLQQAEQEYQQELMAMQREHHNTSQLQAENLLMSIQFSTGESELKPHYKSQLDALAQLLAISPKVNVDLSGYTDLQGSEERNKALSIARVNAVKKALIERGTEPDRINLFAFGEQAPVVANNENEVSFYDRRVVIKLQHNESSSTDIKTVSNN